MAEPARKLDDGFVGKEDIGPNLRAVSGGDETTPDRANLKVAESNPSKTASGSLKDQELKAPKKWRVNRSNRMQPNVGKGGFVAGLKKRSPLLGIMLLLSGGAGVFMIVAPGMLPLSVYSNLLDRYNTQETSSSIRANKLIVKRLASGVTKGLCLNDTVHIRCRYQRLSNKLLRRLEKNGIRALDSKLDPISRKLLLLNKRPAFFEYTNAAGESIRVKPSELQGVLGKDSEFAKKFARSFLTRYAVLGDVIFMQVIKKFGANITNVLKKIAGKVGLNELANKASSAASSGVAAAVKNGGVDEAENVLKRLLRQNAAQVAEKMRRSAKGNAYAMIAGLMCLATDVPQMITRTARAFQMRQLIKYAVIFLSAFAAVRAGDASGEEVSAVGSSLTAVVDGKSAMESFSIMNTYGLQKYPSPDNDISRFSPGLSVAIALASTNAVLQSSAVKQTCGALTNPATAAAMASGGGPIGFVAQYGLGIGIGWILGKLLPPLLDGAMAIIPMDSILKYFMGDLTQGLGGEPVGDALVAGSAHVMGQTANAGGNMPLTTAQAVAYDRESKKIQLAIAEEDRTSRSPFDITSKYTFLGSIVNQLLPYITKGSQNFSSILSSIGNVISGSLAIISKPFIANAEAEDVKQYQQCADPDILEHDIAAGPYCNIIYGVPVEYLGTDPETVLNYMLDNNLIDDETGEPITDGDYANWLTKCADGSAEVARACTLTENDPTSITFALYTIDHRVQMSMDGEGES